MTDKVRVGGKLGALIAEGSSAARSKQYDRAISLLTAALQTNPDKNIAFVYLLLTVPSLIPKKDN